MGNSVAMQPQPALPQPFDAVASGYDAAFTEMRLGRWLRGMVWAQLGRAFQPGARVLELGCGTGEDAVWLAGRGVQVMATDASSTMLDVARRKAELSGVQHHLEFAQLDLNAIGTGEPAGEIPMFGSRMDLVGAGALPVRDDAFVGGRAGVNPAPTNVPLYDGAFSNFGPLNCLADRRALAAALAERVRTGGQLVFVVMGPLCPWESAWYLLHAHPRTAIRRFRKGVSSVVGGQVLRVWYPSPRTLRAEFEPYFREAQTLGIGTLLPPSDLGHLVEKEPELFERLHSIDQRMQARFPWTSLNDHYLMCLERR